MSAVIPPAVLAAMQMQNPPIKNIQQLALRTGYADRPMSIYRIFNGKHQHRSLMAYKKVAAALKWSLEQFFFIAAANEPEAVGAFIRARLKQLDKSTYEFTKELSGTTTCNGGWHDYISGTIKYDRLRIYDSIKTTCGITADALYDALLIENDLTKQVSTDRLLESVALKS